MHNSATCTKGGMQICELRKGIHKKNENLLSFSTAEQDTKNKTRYNYDGNGIEL